MISPFGLYYYSAYGPSLNFLHNWSQTAWLTGFFLPHFSETSSWIINSLNGFGRVLFLAGLCLFLVGAGQIYYAKFTKKSAVIDGLYHRIRHPLYTAFAIMGMGVLFVWPRFTVLLIYVAMLFVYYFLAKKEEKDCLEKFGDDYRTYLESTNMFLPGRRVKKPNFLSLARTRQGRITLQLVLFAITMALSLTVAFGLKNYSLAHLSTYYSKDMATISTTLMTEKDMAKTLEIALSHPEVRNKLGEAGFGDGAKFLNYIVPMGWILADLPLEEIPKSVHGHVTPKDLDSDAYKVLFTKAKIAGNQFIAGVEIIKRTFGREPIIVVKLNKQTGEILALATPPPHVLWGNIPTPLF